MIPPTAAIAAIIAIVAIELYALHQGVNGKMLAISIGAIDALGGAAVAQLVG